MTHPGGRPSLYSAEYCELVIDLGRQGKSKAQMAAHIGVARNTLDNWAADFPEFLSALDRARDYAMAWWEDQAQSGIWAGKAFNAQAWSRSMAARFPADYRENSKLELSGPNDGPIQIDDGEAAARLAKLLTLARERRDAGSEFV